MNKNWFYSFMVFIPLFAVSVVHADNAPIQRVDVINMLGVGIATVTDVTIGFSNDGGATACYSTTIPFRQSISVLAGSGQACSSPIDSVIITPLPEPNNIGVAYLAPAIPTSLSTSLYLNQVVITQNTAPIFDPKNGSLVTMGTIKTTVSSNLH